LEVKIVILLSLTFTVHILQTAKLSVATPASCCQVADLLPGDRLLLPGAVIGSSSFNPGGKLVGNCYD